MRLQNLKTLAGYKLTDVKCWLLHNIVCAMVGCYSTSIFAWYVCNRCGCDFADTAAPSHWTTRRDDQEQYKYTKSV